ncbi:hypothetical protein ACIPL1_20920 [Pseudomonas sp. NPDC090202]|uniref:hypothetical protein n=1 Tax=unclassified Pseudomonas TaxID=196821 RepID=UPI0038210D1C
MPFIDRLGKIRQQIEMKPGHRCLTFQQRPIACASPLPLRQNAGCPTGIHAKCTTPEKQNNFNYLILKDLFLISCWHRDCNSPSTLVIS